MGHLLLICRLALRDLQRRRTEAALVLLAIMVATTTLTLGLVLHDAARDPYERTRAVTGGPDVVASISPPAGGRAADPAGAGMDQSGERSPLADLASASGVASHSGPYPASGAELQIAGRTSDVLVVGRDAAPAAVDQPRLLQGSWVRDGGVVVEAAFASALDVRVGDSITLDARSFEVIGVAVTAAQPPYPAASCLLSTGCFSGATPDDLADAELPQGVLVNPGLVWLTQTDVRHLAGDPSSLSYVMNLRLADPDAVLAFLESHLVPSPDAPRLQSWEDIRDEATEAARDAQILLGIGAWLLGLLAVANLSVLVGGRMADQSRRVGLMKAIGGTPGLVSAVLLTQHILVAIVAAGVGMAVGGLTAPWLAGSSAGLIGSAGTPSITVATVGVVTAVALVVAVVATVVPAVRAARTSTVHALADAARPPRRTGWLIGLSVRLPVPLLLALRVAGRRPRRVVLGAVSIAITVSGIYVALVLNAFLTTRRLAGGLHDPHTDLPSKVLLVVMVMVLCLAAVNTIVITWATVLDDRHTSALARALGATPRDVSVALAAAQALPALIGAFLGVPGGLALFAAIIAITGGDSGRATHPPLWQLITLVVGTALVVAVLCAVPARLGSRRPVAATLQAELA